LARPLEEGTYHIRTIAAPTLAVTAYRAQVTNGSNICLAAHSADSLAVDINWQLTYRDDDSVQLVNAYSGKCMDVAGGKIAQGTNVQQYTDNDTRAQRWVLKAVDGTTCSWNGATYQAYKLYLQADESYLFETDGVGTPQAGANLVLAGDEGTSTDQMWLFEPIPQLRSGGVYQLRTMIDTRYALDVTNASKALSGGVGVYPNNMTNAQMWILTQTETGRWKIVNVNSRMALAVEGGKLADGSRAFQWTDAGYADQRWAIESQGTQKLDGYDRMVVTIGSLADGSGDNYYLNPYQTLLGSGTTSVTVNKPMAAEYMPRQEWLLLPSVATDPSMPVPTDLGVTGAIGASSRYTECIGNAPATHCPTWTATTAWCSSGTNHYETRWRSRELRASNSTWGDWTEWSAWRTELCRIEGQRAWGQLRAYNPTLDPAKQIQAQYQVRCVGYGDTANVVGAAATCTVNFYYKPTVTLGACSMTSGGLRVDYVSDYWAGSNRIVIQKVAVGSETIFSGSLAFDGLDNDSSVLVPMANLSRMVGDGEEVTFTFAVGNDMYQQYGGTDTQTVACAYEGNEPLAPEITAESGHRLKAVVPDYGDTKGYLVMDGRTEELEGTQTDGEVVYHVAYPIGKGFSVWFDSVSADQDTWGVHYETIAPDDPRVDRTKCHVFTWGDEALCLTVDVGTPITASRSVDPDYESVGLNGRDNQFVSFSSANKTTWKVSAALPYGSDYAASDVLAMADARHVLYRSPAGDYVDAAVTGLETEDNGRYLKVDVDLVEESL
jgi:hypothetical protein